jgi:hypothetical protein
VCVGLVGSTRRSSRHVEAAMRECDANVGMFMSHTHTYLNSYTHCTYTYLDRFSPKLIEPLRVGLPHGVGLPLANIPLIKELLLDALMCPELRFLDFTSFLRTFGSRTRCLRWAGTCESVCVCVGV